MNILNGPIRLILLHSGKYDYAEVEIGVPLHLVGPNNVGKTSLIAALQFLYLDQQRRMYFSRSIEETRRYYFPDPNSYILFECRTPSGFQVLGVHGLGPLKGYDFERFSYTGRFLRDDYLDTGRRILPADQVKANLSVKGFTGLEPRHLRAALTGIGDGKGVDLGLVPLKNRDNYIRFCTVFRNLLRLSHLRQEELKALLLDIYAGSFQQKEVDLERRYSENYRRVKADAVELAELKILEPEIRELVEQDVSRRLLRGRLPVLWQRIETEFLEREEAFEAARKASEREIADINREEEEIRLKNRGIREELKSVSGKLGVLRENFKRLGRDEEVFRDFIPEWAEKEKMLLERKIEDLGIRLKGAAEERPERIEKRIAARERELERQETLFAGLEKAAFRKINDWFDRAGIEDLFRILNPDILGLPLGEGGLRIGSEGHLEEELNRLMERIDGGQFRGEGYEIALSALTPPDLRAYSDPEEIKARIQEIRQGLRRDRDVLEAARDADRLRAELESGRKQRDGIIRKLIAFERYQELKKEADGWRRSMDELVRLEDVLTGEQEELERRSSDLAVRKQGVVKKIEAMAAERRALQEQVRALTAPPVEWLPGDVENMPGAVSDIIRVYRRESVQEADLSRNIARGIDLVEKRTYGRYSAEDESGVLERLTDELEGLQEREKAVRELWTSIAVGLKSAFKGLGKDLETLKIRVGDMNRSLRKVSVSNLERLRLQVAERPEWTKRIRELARTEEMPLFADPLKTEEVVGELGGLLSRHPRVELSDLFDLHFEVHGAGGDVRTYHHLENIESHGTTITIKVLVNLILLRGLLGTKNARIPFYLDEVSSLDHNNLKAIVEQSEALGFIPVLASPDAMAVAENIYFLTEQQGRVVIEPESSRIRLKYAAKNEEGGEHGEDDPD